METKWSSLTEQNHQNARAKYHRNTDDYIPSKRWLVLDVLGVCDVVCTPLVQRGLARPSRQALWDTRH
eukprot:6318386-Amphidinium_carterae.1